MRPLWSGTISFGLINIPIKLYSAVEERNLDFDMLRKKDLCPIRYARICKNTGEEVQYRDIVKGYKLEEGDYVVLEKEDFKRASPRKSETIDIKQFIDEKEINSKYYEKPYYLEPDKGAAKAYVLLREALKQSKKVAVAEFVFRTKDNLVVVKPDRDILLLNNIRFYEQFRDTKELKVPDKVNVTKPEIEMAVKLVDQLSSRFMPDKYRDTYREELEKLIAEKAKGRVVTKKEKVPEPTASGDLMAQLRASLQESEAKHLHKEVH